MALGLRLVLNLFSRVIGAAGPVIPAGAICAAGGDGFLQAAGGDGYLLEAGS